MFVDIEQGDSANAHLQQTLDIRIDQLTHQFFLERAKSFINRGEYRFVGFALLDALIDALFDEDPFQRAIVELVLQLALLQEQFSFKDILKRELLLKESKLQDELHYRTLERIFIEERIYKRIEQCKTNEAVLAAVYEGFGPFKKELVRELIDTDVERLLQVRIRRISLFDINKHREEMAKVKADLAETRKHLKNLTKYAISHLEALLEKYGPMYPRLTRSSRYDEVDAREVAFKSFKVAYDRESGYIGYKVSGEEFRVDCTKFDKLLLFFRDGHYQVVELPEKLFVGPDVVFCELPERDRIFTLAYTNREATYLKRFTFGGAILKKIYHSIPPKSRVLFFEADTPAEIFIKYKPAPYQKINQQTCDPSQVEVKGPKTRGRQISIKDVSSINSKPPRGWDPEGPTTKLQFI